MFFSSSTSQQLREEISSIFDLAVVSKHKKYLGLPFMVERAKTRFFNDIKLRVLSKLSSWQRQYFSSGGKEVLIKAVAQAVLPQLLKEGLRWRIGNGKQISVHNKNWIQNSVFRLVPWSSLHPEAVVADLIKDGQQWNGDLIAQSFSEDISAEILKLPLPRNSSTRCSNMAV